jgi:hypothetical protein
MEIKLKDMIITKEVDHRNPKTHLGLFVHKSTAGFFSEKQRGFMKVLGLKKISSEAGSGWRRRR